MHWRCLFVVLLPLMAGCAATVPSPSTAPGPSDYLHGITSDYSVRLDELRKRPTQVAHRDLRDGLVAGDNDVAVATAMFRHGDYVTLDLVILNRTADPLVLERADITVYDDLGNKLSPVGDYPGASALGLRAQMEQRRGFSDLEQVDVAADFGSSAPVIEPGIATSKTRTSTVNSRSAPRGGNEVTRVSRAIDDDRVLGALPLVQIPGHGSSPYWAYWKATEVTLPLTAVVKVEGHNLLYRFGTSD